VVTFRRHPPQRDPSPHPPHDTGTHRSGDRGVTRDDARTARRATAVHCAGATMRAERSLSGAIRRNPTPRHAHPTTPAPTTPATAA